MPRCSGQPRMATLTILIGLLSHGGHFAHAFSAGAPESACTTQEPIHGPPAQTGVSPYTLTLSSEVVQPSASIMVTISGDDFKGFMMTAYSSDFPVGTMVSTDGQSKLICNDLSITHSGPALKSTVSFNWTAPGDLLDDTRIIFKATIVMQRVTFWMDMRTTTPLVYVVPPPDLPPAGGGSNSDPTTSGPAGVIPPPRSTAPLPITAAPAGIQQFPGHLKANPDCGQKHACFHDCDRRGHCTFIITWDNEGDEIVMTMDYRVPDANQHWIGVGFSTDQEMGDDSVTECIMDDGEVKVQQSFNHGIDNKYLDNKRAAITKQTGKLEDGILHCTFHRKKTYTFDPLVYDLNDDYYLMVAVGEALKGNKIPHTFDVLPPVSDHKVDLQALENVAGEEPPTSVLVQIHGALMLIAWMLMTSVGVMSAKYGKPMFPKINPCGANVWFQLHRGCMMLAAAYTILAVIIMAVQCEGYCQIPQIKGEGKSHWPLHPVLGFMVVILTIANPLMAVFRPAPKSPLRDLFNWSHWGVGVLAWILASFTILIGLDLEKAHAPPEALRVMVAWAIYHILFLVAMETLPRPISKLYTAVAERTVQRGRVYNLERAQHDNLGYGEEDGAMPGPSPGEGAFEMQRKGEGEEKAEKKEKNPELTREELRVQRGLLLCHYAVAFIFTFTMLLVVYLYTPPTHSHEHHW